ncbi:hypothetical protein PHYBOEH_012091 [Phytophthora boehmeriae]|uniref:CDAN1-interacting nuclease 1 n=1 Tax=Phytophthora boehmeriae TaxID=109152 RepID=A0A8T1X1I9_9STRA|nr:hypothetical protein PHYBOEH_012091 [Phytophthora boehmeriae]
MDEDEFALICSLHEFPTDTPLSVSRETFSVIKRQLQHRKFRAALRVHRQEKALKKYVARHGAMPAEASTPIKSESICQIATSVDFSPCMMARLLLEAKFGWSKTTISNIFKEALKDKIDGKQHEEDADAAQEPNHRGLSKEEYARVLLEVRECIAEDVHCSPLADRIRHNMGVEYEYLLLETLRNRRLVFESEDILREKGLSKTPDVRLLLPIGVQDPKDGQLHVVNWIDSKAMFGDRHTHETENANQLQGYVNRYGPGMVIYWFGHVAHLSSDNDIFITDTFPQDISLPGAFDPLASTTKLEEGTTLSLRPVKAQQIDFDEDWVPITTCEL